MTIPLRGIGVITVMASLPVIEAHLPTLALSAAGGLVSAAAFFGLLEMRNRWRWRQVNHAGASMLLSLTLQTTKFIGKELEKLGFEVPVDYPRTDAEYDLFEQAWTSHWELVVREDVAEHIEAFTREALWLIEVTPALRDDPILLDRVFQARMGVHMLLPMIPRMAGEGVPPEGLLASGQRIFIACTRALRATCIHVQKHIDQRQAQRDVESLQDQLRTIRRRVN